MRIVLACTLFALAQLSHALGNTETVETRFQFQFQSQAALATGHELRGQIQQAWWLVKQGELEGALNRANETLEAFHQLFDPDLKQIAFQSDDDYQAYIKSNDSQYQRIDWSYREALHVKAYIYSGVKNFYQAMRMIEKIEAIAPVSAGTAVEKGYILSQLEKNQQAYASYHQAYELANQYPSQSVYKAAALRGMGFVLIEQNELNRAEGFFKQSLQLEPGNKTAINELKYIEHLKNGR